VGLLGRCCLDGRAFGAGAGGQAAEVLGLLRVPEERFRGVLGAGLPGTGLLSVRAVGRRHGDRLPDHRPRRAAQGDLRAEHGLPGLEGAARRVRRAAHGHVPQDHARGGQPARVLQAHLLLRGVPGRHRLRAGRVSGDAPLDRPGALRTTRWAPYAGARPAPAARPATVPCRRARPWRRAAPSGPAAGASG
jgi:hypothetical protein